MTLAGSNSLADLRERLKVEHGAVIGSLRRGLHHAMAAGDILTEAKAQLRHGDWLPCLESCNISERTAQRYVRLAKHRGVIEAKCDTVSDLGVRGALALIATPHGTELDGKSVDLAAHAADLDLGWEHFEEIERAAELYEAQRAETLVAIRKTREALKIANHLEPLDHEVAVAVAKLMVAGDEWRSAEDVSKILAMATVRDRAVEMMHRAAEAYRPRARVKKLEATSFTTSV